MKQTAYSRQFGVVLLSFGLLCGPAGIHAQNCAVDAPLATSPGTFSSAALIPRVNPVYDKLPLVDGTVIDLHKGESLSIVGSAAGSAGLGASGVAPSPVSNLGTISTPDWANFIPTTDGKVTRINYIDISASSALVQGIWTNDLKRTGCASDKLDAAPVTHVRNTATAAFQAAYTTSLVYVGTRFGCSTRQANRVYALNADTGAIEWTFNGTGTFDMDYISSAPVLDAATDTLYVTTERTYSASQDSVWAIDVLTGTLNWSANANRIWAGPVLANGTLYVANLIGEIKALDPATGSELWSLSNGGWPLTENLAVAGSKVAAADLYGNIWVAQDSGASASWAYTTTLPNGVAGPSSSNTVLPKSPLTANSNTGYLYVGGNDGKVYQLDVATGTIVVTRTVDATVSDVTGVVTGFNDSEIFALSSSGTLAKYCAPFMYPPGTLTADGDINTDGFVNAADVLLATQAAIGSRLLDPIEFGHGDVSPLISNVPNPDGTFNLADTLVIIRKALGQVSF